MAIRYIADWGSSMDVTEITVSIQQALVVPIKDYVNKTQILPIVIIVISTTVVIIILIIRRFAWSSKINHENEFVRRRRSSSYNDSEVFQRLRNRSLSNDSWMKQQSSRNRLFSNSFHRMSTSMYNTAYLLDESRRLFSYSMRQSSVDVVRDSDLQLDLDEFFWNILEDEEEERRQQHLRDRINSKNSSGSKGNKDMLSLSPAKSCFCLLGPSGTTIEYSTVAPPPSWSKANRNLILSYQTWDLSRVVSLELLSAPAVVSSPDVGMATLIIQKGKSPASKQNQSHKSDKFVLKTSVSECSVHVHDSPECGVLDIYEKGADRNEWIELTFSTASSAAQFQMDFLALQILGPLIHNMYVALRIIHQGSDVFSGMEPLLHHVVENNAETPQESNPNDNDIARADGSSIFVEETGIAWDDVMRCLGSSFPSIRLRLEAMRWMEIYGSFSSPASTKKNKEGSTPVVSIDETKTSNMVSASNVTELEDQQGYAMMNALYSKRRRLLLGPVDFFRLFVSKLPESALPEGDCSRLRMERMLRLRKRVARAAVLIQAYSLARTVVNRGWNISTDVKYHKTYWKRRFAFDDNIDNHQHDTSASNEYYEATVSRDIDCQVRGLGILETGRRSRFSRVEDSTVTSLYQAYSLVSIHSFKWYGDEDGSHLHYRRDPVQSILSLQTLISSYPALDFFVVAIFLPSQTTVIVHVYVRSLARGIDPKFDNNIQRFVESSESVRKRKLEVSIQLEIEKDGPSFLERCLLLCLLFLLRFAVRRRLRTPNSTVSNDRTSLPPLNLSKCCDTYHFGGSLQSDDALPKNYVATTALLDSLQNCNFITRMMLSYIELGGLSRNVADVTFVLAGEDENELPERALCTLRVVRASFSTLPISCVSLSDNASSFMADAPFPIMHNKGIASLMLKLFVTDPFVAAFGSIIRSVAGVKRQPSPLSSNQIPIPDVPSCYGTEQNNVNDSVVDPFERAINQLVSILEGISVPIKTKEIGREVSRAYVKSIAASTVDNTYADTVATRREKEFELMAVLKTVDRSDIVRFFIGSNCNLKTASRRIVESAIWRGSIFPIDIRTCRIELQTGQFFHQGFDLRGNPVFYFRNFCLGPWRKDPEAVIAAVLHRLETSLSQLARTNPFVQCTLIVMAGRPYRSKCETNNEVKSMNASTTSKKSVREDRHDQSTIASTAISTLHGTEVEDQSNDEGTSVGIENHVPGDMTNTATNNPRVFPGEHWNIHTSKELIGRIVNILLTHYPERLSHALVVIGHGNKKYARSLVGSMLYLAGLISSARTRDKVRFLTNYSDLQSYVHRSELVTLVGGTQVVEAQHFECK